MREISTARLERFLKLQGTKSDSKAYQSRVLLNLILKFAMRHGAIRHNPLAGTSPLRRPPRNPKALTLDELSRIRKAAREWRTGPGLPGPKPDGQLRDIIEVMLGSSARIGEALALRKCDVDMTVSPPTVHIQGTVIVRKGAGVTRQGWPKTLTLDFTRLLLATGVALQWLMERLESATGESSEALTFELRTFIDGLTDD